MLPNIMRLLCVPLHKSSEDFYFRQKTTYARHISYPPAAMSHPQNVKATPLLPLSWNQGLEVLTLPAEHPVRGHAHAPAKISHRVQAAESLRYLGGAL